MFRDCLILICIAAPLAACSSQQGSDWSSVYAMAKTYVSGDPGITLEQAAAIPYATIGVRIGDGPQAILVLGTASGDDMIWVAGRNIAIQTRAGRVVRTAGLAHDLTNSWRLAKPRGEDANAVSAPDEASWMASFADQKVYATQIDCRSSPPVSDSVVLLGKAIQTSRVDEHCQAPAIGWNFTNNFWIDAKSGFVWRSVQHVSPGLDALEIEVFRPPGG